MRIQGADIGKIISALQGLLPRSECLSPPVKEALCNLGSAVILDLYDTLRQSDPPKDVSSAISTAEPGGERRPSESGPSDPDKSKVRPLNRWPEEQEEYLRAHYHTATLKEIAAHLGRSFQATQAKARSLHLSKVSSPPWSLADLEFLDRNYRSGVPAEEIAKALNRTIGAVRAKAISLAMKREVTNPEFPINGAVWTSAELDYLREHNSDSIPDVAAALGRSVSAVCNKYDRYGIKRVRRQDEDIRVRNVQILKLRAGGLRVVQIAERLGMTPSNVANICAKQRASSETPQSAPSA